MNTDNQKTILLVEDETIIAMAKKMDLEKYGYKVVIANKAEKALQLFEEKNEIDLILMDIKLDTLDGTQVAEIILKNHDIPVIFLSSHEEPEIVEKTEKITSYGYIEKNSSTTVLDASIKMAFKLYDAYHKVKESEEKYHNLFENAEVGMYRTMFDGSQILDMNEKFLKIFGYTREEMVDKPSIIHWAVKEERNKMLKLLEAEDKVTDFECEMLSKRGEIRTCITSLKLYRSEGILEGSILDITERKRAEEELSYERYLLHTLMDNLPDAIYFKDTDSRFIRINKALSERFGLSDPGQALSKTDFDFFSQEHAKPAYDDEQEIIRSGRSLISKEEKEVWPDGRQTWVLTTKLPLRDNQENIIGTFGVSRDITERKITEEELFQSRALFHSLVESIPQNVFSKDMEGRITFANRHYCEAEGKRLVDILGRTDYDIHPLELADKYRSDDRKIMETGQIFDEDEVHQPLGGEKFYTHVIKAPLYDSKRNAIGIIGLFYDITERKRTEEELNKYRDHLEDLVKERTAELIKSEKNLMKARDQAEAANKAKTVFLSSMSHEIRTPLNAVLGFSQLMLRDESLSDQQKEWMQTINRSGEHLLNLINNILEISRIESGRESLNYGIFDLRGFLNDLEKMFHARIIEKNQILRIEIDPAMPRYIELDCNKLSQIFINLIGNAVKFTDEGTITVRAKAEREKKENYRLIAEVEDTGPGISPEDMKKITGTFEQTDISLKKGGTGLGLTISRSFARIMGGDIIVKSEVGKGSIFHLELNFKEIKEPVMKDIARDRHVIGLEENQAVYRILIADDEPNNRELLSEILQKTGFEVDEASDGREALEKVKIRHPDLIFLDMRMPVMDGYEAIKEIKSMENSANIPIISVTASAFTENEKEMLETGADGYIRKPYKINEIFDIIQSFLDVRYIYGLASGAEEEEVKIEIEAIKKLPDDLVRRLLEATLRADLDLFLEIIGEASDISPDLSTGLRKLAKRYRYDELIKLLSERGKL